MNSIPTFVINLKNRIDRKEHILNEFSGRNEFNVTIVEPEKHAITRVSLWKTIKQITENMMISKVDFFIICEDDHRFTENYQKKLLLECIEQADKMGADILSGGVSGLQQFVRVSPDIFWMGYFSGLQFTVIYRRFFKTITASNFEDSDIADQKISLLTENKFVIYPFISIQKEFGYSDVTPLNNNTGRVDAFFEQACDTIKFVNDVSIFYKQQKEIIEPIIDDVDYENFYIPTYIINLPERTDRLAHIKKQFEEKNEFAINIIEAIKHEKGNLGLWLTIRKIVEQAILNEDDIIIICEDDHEFTDHYTKHSFIKDVIEAHTLGAGILLGGIGHFFSAALITESKFWIGGFYCTQFTVIYKSLFQRILDTPFDDKVTADGIFSQITSNKLVTFPFISIQKYLGYSDINIANNNAENLNKRFRSTSLHLEKMKNITKLYSNSHL